MYGGFNHEIKMKNTTNQSDVLKVELKITRDNMVDNIVMYTIAIIETCI